jgi:MGT family glycosyltransferase
MSTILAYTSPAIGHLFPMTPVLLELAGRGHRVHVRTLGDQVDMLRSLGLEADAIDDRVPAIAHSDMNARSTVDGLRRTVRTFTERAVFDGPDLQRALTQTAADMAVVDINAWGARMAAEAWGGPWVAFCPYTPPLRSRGTPPFGPGFAPRPGIVGTARDAILRPFVFGTLERATLPGVNRLREGWGLSPLRDADGFYRTAPAMIVATSEPFEYAHPEWAPDVRMVGALPWEPASTAADWVSEPGDPYVLVTTSSEYQGDEELARAAAQGLGGEAYRVVITMPAGVTELGPLPPNVRLEEFVPHGPILARAAVAVTHGGMGATQKALAAAVPTVVVPFGRDQLEVAARVVHSGSGVRVPRKRLTADSLREAVRAAAGMTDGARRVADGFRAAGGAEAAADVVESVLHGADGRVDGRSP